MGPTGHPCRRWGTELGSSVSPEDILKPKVRILQAALSLGLPMLRSSRGFMKKRGVPPSPLPTFNMLSCTLSSPCLPNPAIFPNQPFLGNLPPGLDCMQLIYMMPGANRPEGPKVEEAAPDTETKHRQVLLSPSMVGVTLELPSNPAHTPALLEPAFISQISKFQG